MVFEKFEGKGKGRPAHDPEATVYPSNGHFVFNTKAKALFPESEYYRYQIDTEAEKIAVEPCDKADESAYKATVTDHAMQLSAVGVLREFGHDVSQWDGKARLSVEKDGGLIILDVSDIDREE